MKTRQEMLMGREVQRQNQAQNQTQERLYHLLRASRSLHHVVNLVNTQLLELLRWVDSVEKYPRRERTQNTFGQGNFSKKTNKILTIHS